ncbi:hypothetical protein F3J45_18010 [Pantoea sp. Ap-967]|nr:hypothetical protein [Pantoea sp. Ap-967]
MTEGAALQPIRGASPLLQGITVPCRSGLAPRMGRKAAPCILSADAHNALPRRFPAPCGHPPGL